LQGGTTSGVTASARFHPGLPALQVKPSPGLVAGGDELATGSAMHAAAAHAVKRCIFMFSEAALKVTAVKIPQAG
jgi:hypothetical protein